MAVKATPKFILKEICGSEAQTPPKKVIHKLKKGRRGSDSLCRYLFSLRIGRVLSNRDGPTSTIFSTKLFTIAANNGTV